ARAREEIPTKLKEEQEWASKLLQELKAKNPPRTEADFIKDYLNMGYDQKGAEIRAHGEYGRYIAEQEGETRRLLEAQTRTTATRRNTEMKELEADATSRKDASVLKKPWLAFKAAPLTVRVGVLATAAALGLGVAWAVNRWRHSRSKKRFTERLESERGG